MKNGNYYFMQETDDKSEWLIKYVGDDKDYICGPCLNITHQKFYAGNGEWGDKRYIKTFRLASSQEIKWLDDCIEADEYVNAPIVQDKINNSYLIY